MRRLLLLRLLESFLRYGSTLAERAALPYPHHQAMFAWVNLSRGRRRMLPVG
jgi:hypothetical protein